MGFAAPTSKVNNEWDLRRWRIIWQIAIRVTMNNYVAGATTQIYNQ